MNTTCHTSKALSFPYYFLLFFVLLTFLDVVALMALLPSSRIFWAPLMPISLPFYMMCPKSSLISAVSSLRQTYSLERTVTVMIAACHNHQLKSDGNLPWTIQRVSMCQKKMVTAKSRHLFAFSTMWARASTCRGRFRKFAKRVGTQ